MKKHLLFKLSLLLIALSSCTSTRDVTYFQGMDHSKNLSQAINNYSPLTIQAGDLLSVNVSSLTQEASIFNNGAPGSGSGVGGGMTTANTGASSGSGYLVDQKGELHLPLIPAIKVSGLTISEAQITLRNNMLNILKDPVVNLRILNFKYSVIGDVGHSGIFPIQGDRLTFIEALSQAGDLTLTGKRKNILLIREIDGERKFITIDITSSDLFNSPYYYIKNNDIIYVEASPAKYASLSGFNRSFPIITSVLSLAVSLIGIIIFTTKK